MRLYKNKVEAAVALTLLAGLYVTMSLCTHQASVNLQIEKDTRFLPEKMVYKTIPDSQNAIGLIGFILHEEPVYTGSYGSYHVFSAIIKDIDPAQDNYKSICHDVISDIIQTCGGRTEIIVNVYDSVEAYNLARMADDPHVMLTDEQQNYAAMHHIAAYGLACEDGGTAGLVFYPDIFSPYREETTLEESASAI